VSCHWLAGRDPWTTTTTAEEELWPIRPPCRTVHKRVAEFLPPAHLLAAFVILALAPPASYYYTARQHHRRLSRTASHCALLSQQLPIVEKPGRDEFGGSE
jgi:hypothetical protein